MSNNKIVEFKEKNLINILENNYEDIFESIEKEEYIIDYNSFYEFTEILIGGETVGFLTLDTFMLTEKTLCLNERYILPEFRGKGLLIEIIRDFWKMKVFLFTSKNQIILL